MTARQLDQELIDHACSQLYKVARRHVHNGLGPASAASAAIRETKALFPPDWQLAVQGDDTEEEVEVWEVEHKRTIPCVRIKRQQPVPVGGVKLTENQRDALDYMIRSPNQTSSYFPPSLRRVLPKLVEKGLARTEPGDPQQRARYRKYRATEAGKVAYYAALGER
jgi:hypothetical protein